MASRVLSMRCTPTKPIHCSLLTSSGWNEQSWCGGETLLGQGFLKRKIQSYYIISQYQGHYADQSKWGTKLTVGSEATSSRLFILVNESDHNLLKSIILVYSYSFFDGLYPVQPVGMHCYFLLWKDSLRDRSQRGAIFFSTVSSKACFLFTSLWTQPFKA